MPDVPRRASQTIRGRVKVSVRVIVDPDGTVFAALTDHAGPSRYFERLAIDAAKKWTFPRRIPRPNASCCCGSTSLAAARRHAPSHRNRPLAKHAAQGLTERGPGCDLRKQNPDSVGNQ